MIVKRLLKRFCFIATLTCGAFGCSDTPGERESKPRAAQEYVPEVIVSLNGQTMSTS